MVVGYGSYEIPGYTYDRVSVHHPDVVIGESTLEDMCVKCHVVTIAGADSGHDYHGHSFAPQLEACNSCHATPDGFDYHGRRTEIQNLMDSASCPWLPNDGTEPLFTTASTTRDSA